MQTREQRYVSIIHRQVEAMENDAENKEKYKTMTKNLPVLVRSAGLIQALYFAKTRNKGSEKLVEHLSKVLEQDGLNLQNRDLSKYLETASLDEYILLTEKTLLALNWYKRFADIYIKQENGATVNEN